MKDEIKKATQLAENELQEKKIEHLKNIIKSLLQKRKEKEKVKNELEEEIKLIKQDIDDFKSGRLDKVKERHEVNEKADKIFPINITIINDNSRKIYPLHPWRWNYEVVWNYQPTYTSNYTSNSLVDFSGSSSIILCGTSTATYTSGTYTLSGGSNIINL
jgi:hypothetical protein